MLDHGSRGLEQPSERIEQIGAIGSCWSVRKITVEIVHCALEDVNRVLEVVQLGSSNDELLFVETVRTRSLTRFEVSLTTAPFAELSRPTAPDLNDRSAAPPAQRSVRRLCPSVRADG
jgi:hypothetical protein